jgi:hypothetical protein
LCLSHRNVEARCPRTQDNVELCFGPHTPVIDEISTWARRSMAGMRTQPNVRRFDARAQGMTTQDNPMDSPELVPAHNFESGLGSFGTQIQRVIIGASGGIGEALANHPERCHALLKLFRLSRSGPRAGHPVTPAEWDPRLGPHWLSSLDGSRTWDADRGDDCEGSPTVSCSRQTDRSNLPANFGCPVRSSGRSSGVAATEISSVRRNDDPNGFLERIVSTHDHADGR